jgi:hypothetical protein
MSKYHPQFVPIESGTVFGRYTVKEHWKHGIYFCECVCGKRLKISSWELTHGRRQGCNRCVGGLAKGEASFNELYGRYRRNAEKFKRDFTLTKGHGRRLFIMGSIALIMRLGMFFRTAYHVVRFAIT